MIKPIEFLLIFAAAWVMTIVILQLSAALTLVAFKLLELWGI